MNSHTEMAGGITLSLTSGATTDGGTVTIGYNGANITNVVGTDVDNDEIVIDICGADGGATNTSIDDNAISMTVEAGGCTGTETIDVSGVLLGIADSGLDEVTASISADGDIRLGSGANEVTVISNVVDELENTVVGRLLTVVRHTGDPDAEHMADEDGVSRFHLLIPEAEVDSFDGAEIDLDFSGIPVGAEVTLDAWVTASSNIGRGKPGADLDVISTHTVVPDTSDPVEYTDTEDVDSDQIGFSTGRNTDNTLKAPSMLTTVDAEDNSATIVMFLHPEADDDDDTEGIDEEALSTLDGMLTNAKDTVIVRGSINFDDDDTEIPLGDLDIQVTADVGPAGREDPGRTGYTGIPRFDPDPTAAVTVIDVESDQTTLVAPYALATLGFDTGFAISNMNTDSDQAGAIMFLLYQNSDEPIEYTTSAGSPGRGLTSGMLEAGATYAVLLTEILDAAGVSDGFSGYVKIVTDFTGADGIAYISDWAAFSATATLEEE
jgi:hypothetical protein